MAAMTLQVLPASKYGTRLRLEGLKQKSQPTCTPDKGEGLVYIFLIFGAGKVTFSDQEVLFANILFK